jgi:hypothetical protein
MVIKLAAIKDPPAVTARMTALDHPSELLLGGGFEGAKLG